MEQDIVLFEKSGAVGTIVLNRPDKLNALNQSMLEALDRRLHEAEADDSISVVVIKGAGRAFSAGVDLDPASHKPDAGAVTADRDRIEGQIDRWERLWRFPKPVIAQVHGYCIAASTVIALSCDFIVISDECRIRFPSLPLGGGYVSTYWALAIGPRKAKEMDFIAGSEITGVEAKALGWANHCFPEAELEQRTRSIAEAVARTPLDLLRLKKKAINRVMEMQHYPAAVRMGAEWDSIAHFSEGATRVRELIKVHGLKGAIAVIAPGKA
jgi:enoyl-CoA hydratase